MAKLLKDCPIFLSWLGARLERARKECSGWAERYAVDPAYAFSWSDAAFMSAATLKVAAYVKEAADGGKTTDETLLKYVRDRVLTSSKYARSSTSATSNLMDRYELVAWAETLEVISDPDMFKSVDQEA